MYGNVRRQSGHAALLVVSAALLQIVAIALSGRTSPKILVGMASTDQVAYRGPRLGMMIREQGFESDPRRGWFSEIGGSRYFKP